MKIEIADRSLMMVFLMEECNNSCPHCVRFDEPMSPGYRLSFDQLKMCLQDCQKLRSIEWVHFSGGEPTLWREGGLDLVDLLVEISKAGFEPGFTTNGLILSDYEVCEDLFGRYLDRSEKNLRLYITIDTFHDNFDAGSGRSRALDNFLRFKNDLSADRGDRLELKVLTVISKDERSLLPDEMVEHYESLGVDFRFLPLEPVGKGRALLHLCPDTSSDNPEDLGAYHRYRRRGGGKRADVPDNIVLIGDDYYFHKPEWHRVARVGLLPEEIIAAYAKEGPAPPTRQSIR